MILKPNAETIASARRIMDGHNEQGHDKYAVFLYCALDEGYCALGFTKEDAARHVLARRDQLTPPKIIMETPLEKAMWITGPEGTLINLDAFESVSILNFKDGSVVVGVRMVGGGTHKLTGTISKEDAEKYLKKVEKAICPRLEFNPLQTIHDSGRFEVIKIDRSGDMSEIGAEVSLGVRNRRLVEQNEGLQATIKELHTRFETIHGAITAASRDKVSELPTRLEEIREMCKHAVNTPISHDVAKNAK